MEATLEFKPESKAATKAREREESMEALREAFPPGSTAYTILRSVSSSGMSRHISVKAVRQDGEVWDMTWHVARVLGDKCHDHHGNNTVRVGGCGMDMGFHLIYSVSGIIYRDIAPATDGARDCGYWIKQRWL